jgi:outer membrane protein assembly factor BamB
MAPSISQVVALLLRTEHPYKRMRCEKVAHVVGIRPAFMAACVASIVSLGIAACGAQPASPDAPSVPCPQPTVGSPTGTPATVVSEPHSGPRWSADVGRPEFVEGNTAYGTAAGHCIVAFDLATGGIDWSVSPPADHPVLSAVTGDASIVLAATGVEVGQAPGAVFPAVDQLAAYDPATGLLRWTVAIPNDGQGMPGLLIAAVVVLTEADGSLIGLSESDGRQLWRDSAPRGCTNNSMDQLEPNASVVGIGSGGSGESALIAYACPAGGTVAAIDPSNGARRWSWRVPTGWDLDAQMATTIDTGMSDDRAAAVPISLVPAANAPRVVAPPPGPVRRSTITNVDGYSEANDVVVLDTTTGRPLWDLTDVPGQALSTVGGAGTLCVLTDGGADCRSALDGTRRWSAIWPGHNASATYPALSCVDQATTTQPCTISANGLLYLALATSSAPAYPPTPGPPSPSGTFLITALNMATGTTTATVPLPSFPNPQSDHAVSLALPPAIVAIADGMILVSPQFQGTDVVQAFAQPGSA